MIHQLIGAALIISGMTLNVSARIALGNQWAITPEVNTICRRGPYKYLNHPMYLGGLFWYSGVFVMLAWWQALSAFIPCYAIIQTFRAKLEERFLE